MKFFKYYFNRQYFKYYFMKKEFKKFEWIGWVLFTILMIPFMLLLMAEPLQYGDEPQMTWTMGWIVCSWLGSLVFSVLLIIVGNMAKKQTAREVKSNMENRKKEKLAREFGHSDQAISDMADRDMQELDNIKELKKMTVTKKFYKENGMWYIDLPEFLEAGLGNKNNLLMVDGADTLLDILAGNKPNKSADGTEVNVTFGNEPFDNYTHTLTKKSIGKNQSLLDQVGHATVEYGAYYNVKELDNHQVWLCPVTEYVFGGNYPDKIWINTIK